MPSNKVNFEACRFCRFSSLCQVHPAIYIQDVPRNVPCLIARQKHNRRRHVPRRTHAPQRNPRLQFLFQFVPKRVRHRRLNEPWRHRIHRNVPRSDLDRNRLRQPDQSSLRRHIIRLPCVPHLRHHRRKIDDPSRPRPHHRGQRLLNAQMRARQVRPQHRLPILHLHPDRQAVARDRRVVHQNIQPPEFLNHLLESRPHLLRVRHIHLHRERCPARRGNLADQRRQLFFISCRGSDLRPRCRQRQRRFAPNSISRRTDSPQRTGIVTCRTSASRASSPLVVVSASTFVTSGTCKSENCVARKSLSSRSCAGIISAE